MWSVDSLRQCFEDNGVPDDYYGFYENKDDALCIAKDEGAWVVFYYEKGGRNELGWGKTESQALNILRVFVINEFKHM